jgi:hypothetical protein
MDAPRAFPSPVTTGATADDRAVVAPPSELAQPVPGLDVRRRWMTWVAGLALLALHPGLRALAGDT